MVVSILFPASAVRWIGQSHDPSWGSLWIRYHIVLPSSTQVRFTVSQFPSFYNFAIVHVPWCNGEWYFVAALMCDEYIQLFVDD
jgi:hypothetical protein